jgi:uncharacterized protein (DUF1697 family)
VTITTAASRTAARRWPTAGRQPAATALTRFSGSWGHCAAARLPGEDGEVGTHVALLRGINIGGHNRVSMADLRQVVSSLGHTGVSTYIQSGNVILTARERDPAAIASAMERAIAEALGVRPSVMVLSRADLEGVIRDNPYPDEPNPKYVHVVFFGQDLGPQAMTALTAAEKRVAERGSRDEATVIGRTLYVHTPDGFGRSELAALLLGRSSSPFAAGTARNWSTVTKLLALCEGP